MSQLIALIIIINPAIKTRFQPLITGAGAEFAQKSRVPGFGRGWDPGRTLVGDNLQRRCWFSPAADMSKGLRVSRPMS